MSCVHHIHKPDRNWNRSALSGNDHTSLQQHCHDTDNVLCGCHIPLYHTYCSHKLQNMRKSWFQTFTHVLNVVCYLMGNSPWCLKFICRRFGTNLNLWPLPSRGSPRHAPYLFHIRTRDLHVGRYPPQLASVPWTAPTLSPSFLLAQALFKPNLFLYKYHNILKPSHTSYLSACEDITDNVRNVSI